MEASKNDSVQNGKVQGPSPARHVYENDTPRWRKYYQQVRRSIRFPRYYKKTLNW